LGRLGLGLIFVESKVQVVIGFLEFVVVVMRCFLADLRLLFDSLSVRRFLLGSVFGMTLGMFLRTLLGVFRFMRMRFDSVLLCRKLLCSVFLCSVLLCGSLLCLLGLVDRLGLLLILVIVVLRRCDSRSR